MNVVCGNCEAVNRVPESRTGEHPSCGRCKAPIFDALPVELTKNNFQHFVERNDLPVVVDFWASWCGPCKMMAPVFAQAAALLGTRIRFAKVNTEQEQGLAARFQIRSIPSLVLFKNGREIDRTAGALNGQSLHSWLTQPR